MWTPYAGFRGKKWCEWQYRAQVSRIDCIVALNFAVVRPIWPLFVMKYKHSLMFEPRFWRIVLLKVAYYATSSARNFAKLCQNYARIPKLCSWFSKLCSQNDVDSVHIGAQKRHQSMFFKYVVVGNLYVFYGSLSQPSAVQTAHAEFVKRGLVTKHVRTKSILLLAKLKHAL